MPRIATLEAERLAAAVLRAHGVPDAIGADVAAHLTLAERSGHASHGLSILPSYLEAIAAGTLDPCASPLLLRDEAGMLSFDGQRGFGQHAGRVALDAAIVVAQRSGACFLTLRNSYHLGRAGHYGEMAARAGLVYLSFINIVGRAPTVAPFGGAQARLSTNPLCFAAPLGPARPPFLLDYATSGIAANKVRLLAAGGLPVPEGLMIDAGGRPSTDAEALAADPPGALLPFGGHKGYALGFLAEVLAGVLSGGGTIAPNNARDGGLRNNLFAIVFDPTRFGDADWQAGEEGAFADYIGACPPSEGSERVWVPGEPEASLQAATAESVEMTDAAWRLFSECAVSVGLSVRPCVVG